MPRKKKQPALTWEDICNKQFPEDWPPLVVEWVNCVTDAIIDTESNWLLEHNADDIKKLPQSKRDYLNRRKEDMVNPPKFLWNIKPRKTTYQTQDPWRESAKKSAAKKTRKKR